MSRGYQPHFVYRKKHCTETAPLNLFNNIRSSIAQDKDVILPDLS